LAARAGFDGVMLSEGHGVSGNLPNPLQVVGWLLDAMPAGWAAPCPLLLPLRAPGIVAEEVAWLAARHPGRVGIGVGVGGHRDQYERLGQDFDHRVGTYESGLRTLVDALGGRGPLAGDAAITACAASPVPVVSAALSVGAVERAARARAGIVGDSLMTVERAAELGDRYRRLGGTGAQVVIRRVWIGERPSRPAMDGQLAWYRAAAGPRQTASWGAIDQTIATPDGPALVEALTSVTDRVGPVAINLRVHAAGLHAAEVAEQVLRIGEEVLPALRVALGGSVP